MVEYHYLDLVYWVKEIAIEAVSIEVVIIEAVRKLLSEIHLDKNKK